MKTEKIPGTGRVFIFNAHERIRCVSAQLSVILIRALYPSNEKNQTYY